MVVKRSRMAVVLVAGLLWIVVQQAVRTAELGAGWEDWLVSFDEVVGDQISSNNKTLFSKEVTTHFNSSNNRNRGQKLDVSYP